MRKLTKIVATISDRKCDVEFIRSLHEAGMNVVRLNTAHQTREDTLRVINNVREVSDKIPLLLDTKGPEIRTVKSEEEIIVKKTDRIKIKGDPNGCTEKGCVYVNYAGFVKDVPLNQRILIDDGDIELVVVEKHDDCLICEVRNDGVIKGRKSINVPDIHIHLPSLSDKDRTYIDFAIDNDLDFIAHSFVRNKEDLIEIQQILNAKQSRIKLISKIENQEGVDNIDEILDHCHGIMVARGDLGIEISAEKIPSIQKKLIKKCIEKNKAVITATQMMHSMIKHPRPTRAEVSDVANAIYDGTDAVMLSGETAYGSYPIEAVKIMRKIAHEVETSKEAVNRMLVMSMQTQVPAFLANSAIRSSVQLSAKAIITDTTSGKTAVNLASYRGKVPIYAQCYDKRVMRELALTYGVSAEFMVRGKTKEEFIEKTINPLIEKGKIAKEDLVVVVAGSFGVTQGATYIEICNAESLMK